MRVVLQNQDDDCCFRASRATGAMTLCGKVFYQTGGTVWRQRSRPALEHCIDNPALLQPAAALCCYAASDLQEQIQLLQPLLICR